MILTFEAMEEELKRLGNQVKQLTEQLHKRQEQENKKKWWKPKVEEDYYYIDEVGYIIESMWEDDRFDRGRMNIGNVFQTKEQAERELFVKQLRFKLKKFAYENNEEEIKWSNDNQWKYRIYYDFEDQELESTDELYNIDFGNVFFTSEKGVEKAIETFKDDLLRYFTSDK